VLPNDKLENWGLVFEYMPSFTCVPTKVRDIQAIIKAAAALDLGVCCAGFREYSHELPERTVLVSFN
jgi:hypothetical protein